SFSARSQRPRLRGRRFPVDLHLAEFEAIDMVQDIRHGDVAERAVFDTNVPDGRRGKSAQLKRVFALLAGDVANVDVPDYGMLRTGLALFIREVDLQDGVGDFADRDVAEENMLDRSAAHGIGFEAQRLV